MVRVLLYVILTFLAGCLLAVVPVVAVCSLPGVRHSNACGHNAADWLIITIPIGFFIAVTLGILLYSKGRRGLDARPVRRDT